MTDYEVARYALRTFVVRGRYRPSFHSIAVPGQHWPNGVCQAQCLQAWVNKAFVPRNPPPPAHIAPHEDCHCGIYGALDYETLHKQYWSNINRIVAVIAAEGLTFIGPVGLRTQYARVVAFWVPGKQLLKVAQEQFPDAKYYGNEFLMLKDYGIPRRPPEDFRGNASQGSLLWRTGERRVDPIPRNGSE